MEAGYESTGVWCSDKIKKLKSEYKKVMDINKQDGKRKDGMENVPLYE